MISARPCCSFYAHATARVCAPASTRSMSGPCTSGRRPIGSQSLVASPLALRPSTLPARVNPFNSHKRQKINYVQLALNGSKPDASSASKLDERIFSGEFTEEGSTKERLTRPIRKLLAKDPIGPGRIDALGCRMPYPRLRL